MRNKKKNKKMQRSKLQSPLPTHTQQNSTSTPTDTSLILHPEDGAGKYAFWNSTFLNTLVTAIVGIAATYYAYGVALEQIEISKRQVVISESVHKAENYPQIALIVNKDKKLHFINVGQQAFVFKEFKIDQKNGANECGVTYSGNTFKNPVKVSIPLLTGNTHTFLHLPIIDSCDGFQNYEVTASLNSYTGIKYTAIFDLKITVENKVMTYTALLTKIEPSSH